MHSTGLKLPSPLYLTCFSLIIVDQPLLFYTIMVHLTPYQSTIVLKVQSDSIQTTLVDFIPE